MSMEVVLEDRNKGMIGMNSVVTLHKSEFSDLETKVRWWRVIADKGTPPKAGPSPESHVL